jgi:hypothetical protein
MSNLDSVLLEIPCKDVIDVSLLNWMPSDLREVVAENPVCSAVVIDSFSRHKEGGTRAYSRLVNIVMTAIGANRPKELQEKKEASAPKEAPVVEEASAPKEAPVVEEASAPKEAPVVEEASEADRIIPKSELLKLLRELYAEVRDHEKLKGRVVPEGEKVESALSMWSHSNRMLKIHEFLAKEPRTAIELHTFMIEEVGYAWTSDLDNLRSYMYGRGGWVLARVERAKLQIIQ